MPGEPAGEDTEWPDAGQEEAFLSEAASRGETPVPVAPSAAEPVNAGKLPALEDCVEKVPAPVKAALDELFRAKFVAVRRFPELSKP